MNLCPYVQCLVAGFKHWLSGSGGEAVWERCLCCSGLAVSSFEPRAACVPLEPGKELSCWCSLTDGSGSTARAEHVQCAMKTLVLPGRHTDSCLVESSELCLWMGTWSCSTQAPACMVWAACTELWMCWGMKLSSYYEAREWLFLSCWFLLFLFLLFCCAHSVSRGC